MAQFGCFPWHSHKVDSLQSHARAYLLCSWRHRPPIFQVTRIIIWAWVLNCTILTLLWCNWALHWLAIVRENLYLITWKPVPQWYSNAQVNSAGVAAHMVTTQPPWIWLSFGPRKQERARRSSLQRPNSTGCYSQAALSSSSNDSKTLYITLSLREMTTTIISWFFSEISCNFPLEFTLSHICHRIFPLKCFIRVSFVNN